MKISWLQLPSGSLQSANQHQTNPKPTNIAYNQQIDTKQNLPQTQEFLQKKKITQHTKHAYKRVSE